MKKTSLLLIAGIMAHTLQSCDPYHNDEYYFKNDTAQQIKFVSDYYGDTINLQCSDEILYAVDYGRGHSPFNSNHYDYIGLNSFGIIYFDDTIALNYSLTEDYSFKKNIFLKHYWTIIKSSKNEHKLLYSIDSTDYHNALVQCGYEQQTD